MFNKFLNKSKQVGYEKTLAKKDAKKFMACLGNEEKIRELVATLGIDLSKWRPLFDEMYATAEKEDVEIFEKIEKRLTVRGEYEGLWELFAHHEERRQTARKEKEQDQKVGIVQAIVVKLQEEGIEHDEFLALFQQVTSELKEEEIEEESSHQQPEDKKPVVEQEQDEQPKTKEEKTNVVPMNKPEEKPKQKPKPIQQGAPVQEAVVEPQGQKPIEKEIEAVAKKEPEVQPKKELSAEELSLMGQEPMAPEEEQLTEEQINQIQSSIHM